MDRCVNDNMRWPIRMGYLASGLYDFQLIFSRHRSKYRQLDRNIAHVL